MLSNIDISNSYNVLLTTVPLLDKKKKNYGATELVFPRKFVFVK